MVDEKGLRKSTILNISYPQVYDNIFYSEDVCDKRSSVRDELAYSAASRYFYTTKERDTLNDPSGEILNSIEKRIGDSFAKQDFMKTLGAELATVRSGFVEIRLPIRSGLLQQDGFVHAGVISSIADSAAGYAAMSLLDEGREVLTAEFKINLLAPA
ncbi:MAG TPA: PaaI family thioesterase, partial [Acidobacteriota bacterium]|nr:PaaI family thioesterase [Acidobacteriota bacterium]